MWLVFFKALMNTVKQHCPKRLSKPTQNKKYLPRITTNLICPKRRAWQYLKSHPSDLSCAYKSIARPTRKTIRSYYRNREIKILQSKNSRSFYTYIDSRLSPKPVTPQLNHPTTPYILLTDPIAVADLFNNFFGNGFSRDNN